MRWAVLAAVLVALAATCVGASKAAAEENRKQGDAYLAKGEYSTALDHYHLACDADPEDYMNFFKRATVFLVMGRMRQAARDLDAVLELKPDFDNARLRRAELNAKLGSLDAAREDYVVLGQENYAQNLQDLASAQESIKAGNAAAERGDHAAAVAAYSEAINVASSDADLRMVRAKAYMATGQNGEAAGDIMRASKLKSGNVEAYFLLSKLYFAMGERADSLTQIRECVKLDDNHKECFDFYKMLKKFNKLMDKVDENVAQGRFAEALQNTDKVRKLGVTEPVYTRHLAVVDCQSNVELKRTAQAAETCKFAAEIDSGNAQVYVYRARMHEQQEDFEAMVQDFQKAVELDGENRSIKEGLARAQKLLKNSLKRDYYKILGISRSANKREITKAYRKLAQEWHPDKFENPDDKAKAEKKFMDIASAKEVLTDPEKRQMFDNGEDPLDAEEERDRQSHRHQPFRGGFNPFGGGGGGGFRFKFQ